MTLWATTSLFHLPLHANPNPTTARNSGGRRTPALSPLQRRPMRRPLSAMASGGSSVSPGASPSLPSSSLNLETGPFLPDATSASLEASINNLSKWIVAAVYGVVVLWRHDGDVLWVAMGSVLNAYLSVVLKRILNHERPDPSLKSGPGMPSSHAQSMFFGAVSLVLFMSRWLQVNAVTLTLGALALASCTYLSWLRVSQQFHTISQVLVGAIVGSTFAVAWFWLWNSFVFNLFIQYIWVRIIVVLGSLFFSVGFVFYVIRHWLKDER